MNNTESISERARPEVQKSLPSRHAIIAGWFSFADGHATAGDLMALEVVCEWLSRAQYTYEIAYDMPIRNGIDWRTADPAAFSDAVFVCGPFEKNPHETAFLHRFRACRITGLNLSMVEPLGKWNPFDILLERDSDERARPDLVFWSKQKLVPVVGVCLVEDYPAGKVDFVNSAIRRLTDAFEMSIVYIDTRLDHNATHLRTPAEIESLIAGVDALITTRLHGSVMALKNGVPVLAIDPEEGGFKIVKQMKEIGWPVVFAPENCTDVSLRDALRFCLSEEARQKARECFQRATSILLEVRHDLETQLARSFTPESRPATQVKSLEAPLQQLSNGNMPEGLSKSSRHTGGFLAQKLDASAHTGALRYVDVVTYWLVPTPFRKLGINILRRMLPALRKDA